MGYAALQDGLRVRQAYDPGKDVVFYETEGDFFEVRAGGFAIFTPRDIHAPCLTPARSPAGATVHKVVIECCVQ